MEASNRRRVGVAAVGLGGAVATSAAAGVELLRRHAIGLAGLPLADVLVPDACHYEDLIFDGWDLNGQPLAEALVEHSVLSDRHVAVLADSFGAVFPRPGIASVDYCRPATGSNVRNTSGHRAAVAAITDDLDNMRVVNRLDALVMINLASTERRPEPNAVVLQETDAFERGIDRDDPNISPAMLYAYAAIQARVPYANFTPSLAADIPALTELADRRGVPVAGKDGKTGQTLIKTVLAPALRARALHVDGWFSTNILGNRDGQVLRDRDSLANKLGTKSGVLDSILGYSVENHIVTIHYYPPRGDDKEAWDNIDVTGFLGERMQIKINLLCKDSVLAAPLVLEIARLLDLAQRRGETGAQEQFSVFFKAPITTGGRAPEHAFHVQQRMLASWLERGVRE
jgi:myo-inositol-1-phosphate synthase